MIARTDPTPLPSGKSAKLYTFFGVPKALARDDRSVITAGTRNQSWRTQAPWSSASAEGRCQPKNRVVWAEGEVWQESQDAMSTLSSKAENNHGWHRPRPNRFPSTVTTTHS